MTTADRLREVLAPLIAAADDSDVYVWVAGEDPRTPAEQLFGLLGDLGLLAAPDRLAALGAPVTAEQTAARLAAVPGDTAVRHLTRILTEPLLSGYGDPWPVEEARWLVGTVLDLLGPETTWWSNIRAGGWEPVTGYAVDNVVIGAGEAATVGFLAIADG